MMHGCVTLDEVFAAAAVRAASLVPETSGYLALAVGDATSRLPFAIDDRMVMLTTEGNVGITKRGEVLPPKQAAAGLRDMLARLLAVSTGTAMPALAAAARTREESDRGVEAVVGEIEAALIPVNRAAARRALARLARETIKAKEQGKVKPRASVRPAAEAPKAEAPRVEVAKVEAPKAAVEALKVEAQKVGAATIERTRVEAPAAAPRKVEAAPVEHTAAPQLVREATTPPPVEAAPAPRVAVAAPPPKVAAAAAPVVAAPTPVAAAPQKVIAAPPPVAAAPPPVAAAPQRVVAALPPVVAAPPVAAAPAVATPVPTQVTSAPVFMLTPRPLVILPTPPPVPVMSSPTPTPVEAEPTPTVLGMAVVEVDGPAPEVASTTEIDAIAATITAAPVHRTPTPTIAVRWTPTPAPAAQRTPTPAPAVMTPHLPAPVLVAEPGVTAAREAEKTIAAPRAEEITAVAAPAELVTTSAPAELVTTSAPAELVTISAPAKPATTLAEPATAEPATALAEPATALAEPATAPAEPATAPAEPMFTLDTQAAPTASPQGLAIVLGQPSEPAELAFEMTGRAPRPIAEPITPPFALDGEAAPRELPVARPAIAEMRLPPRINHAPMAHTRADDLLARFGASCADDAQMREAAACLRRMAGIEATPPPARVEIRAEAQPEPDHFEQEPQIPLDVETPISPRTRARRGRPLPSFAVTLAVLFLGIAGGGALVRLRPDLFGVGGHPIETRPPATQPASPKPAEPPALTAEPRGAEAPSWAPSNGARAERTTNERAR
ncbi:MAG: hypothetical protein QM820_28125 [Minicystis sp.]